MRFLIDECLSPELVKLAQEKGYGESTHVVWRKLAGKKDWELKPVIVDGDWTFVTRNSVPSSPRYEPASRDEFARLGATSGMSAGMQAREGSTG